MDKKKVSIKLLIDTKRSKVVFAEAGKDFVDFLFFLMGLPMGTVIRLLTNNSMVGSIGNIYESIEILSKKYFQAEKTKDSLLYPMLSDGYSPDNIFLSLEGNNESNDDKNYYKCTHHPSFYVSDDSRAVCPSCKKVMKSMFTYVPYVGPDVQVSTGNGFVNGVATYMVMDDLVVEPMSSISSFNLLKEMFDAEDFGHLQEKVVYLDMAQGLKLLKSSLKTKNVLTTVFLGKMGVKRKYDISNV